ncbi:hypothetical protein J7J12_02130 [bacterium]|nr:hypothetical protein [bacterium]
MIVDKLKKIANKWIFLYGVVLLYIIIFIFSFSIFSRSLRCFLNFIIKLFPALFLVFLIMVLINLFIDKKTILKFLGKEAGAKGWIIAIFAGILSTGPIYMWYPVISDLKNRGMKNSLMACFLYSRAVKIFLMPMMIYYFGIKFTFVFTIYLILFSIINGVLVDRLLHLF